MKNDDPLKVQVRNGRLEITIGVSTLAECTLCTPDPIIVPKRQQSGFAKDVAHELTREDEVGNTKLTMLLDAMMEAALNNGSIHYDLKKTDQLRKKARL
jgi:hypothetical protein